MRRRRLLHTSLALAGFGLRALGYVEGQNIAIEFRHADGQPERMPALAAELVALNPAVIVATISDTVRAVQHASSTIAIVIPALPDPVESGLVASLARPGGTVTGLAITAGVEALVSAPGVDQASLLMARQLRTQPACRRPRRPCIPA